MKGRTERGVESEARVHPEKQTGHDREEEEIVDHGDHAGGKEVVEGVDVGGHARYQAADGVAVKVAHRQALQVRRKFRCACRTWSAGRRAA